MTIHTARVMASQRFGQRVSMLDDCPPDRSVPVMDDGDNERWFILMLLPKCRDLMPVYTVSCSVVLCYRAKQRAINSSCLFRAYTRGFPVGMRVVSRYVGKSRSGYNGRPPKAVAGA